MTAPSARDAARAGITVAATIASLCITLALSHPFTQNVSAGIIAVILTLGLARRPRSERALHWALYPFAVAGIGVVAGAEGYLLHVSPAAGAIAFVIALFLSVYLRNFGARARAVGTIVALPFVSMLVVPVARTPGARGPFVDLALVACAGFIALACATVAQLAAARLGLSDRGAVREAPARAPSPTALTPTTKMSIQMAVALALAFAIGFTFFRDHWAWTVLTAFIVCSGAIGRVDAAWKGVLRLLGALAGTAGAFFIAHVWAPAGVYEAIGIFIAIFFGLWLREKSYAIWACCMTLVFALLSRSMPAAGPDALLGLRLEAILAGAVCAVATTWFVLPIRTVGVVRRRLADALLALDEFIANAHLSEHERETRYATYERRMADLERVAAPLRLHRRLVPVADHAEHPGRWIDLAHRCHGRVRDADIATLEPKARGEIRRAIGRTRKAIGAFGNPAAAPEERAVSSSLDSVDHALATARREG